MTLFQAPLNQAEPVRVILSSTAITEIIPSAAYKQAVAKITVTNISTLAVAVDLSVYNGSTDYYLRRGKAVPANDAIEIYDEVLQTNHSLRALTASSSALHVHAIFSLGEQR